MPPVPLLYFTRQPEDIVISLGQPFQLSANAELTTTYRWQRDGVFITSAAAPGPSVPP